MTGMTGPLVIAAAGVLAGIVGTAGGITSLVSYPALLAVGVPAFAANVANSVALVACWPGSALASRPELEGRGRWLCGWGWVAAGGGAAGAALLLCTPSQDFARTVPFLVAAGSLALLAQPWISARFDGRARYRTPVLLAGLLAVSAYNGYFGAGSGVMTLALLLVTVDRHTARANALKNMLIGAASVVSALAFTVLGHVVWQAAVPLGAGMLAGSMIGPKLARRIPAGALRWLAALLGLGLAARLWLGPP
ncbi:MAG TPA: sulfite exporter TauE/SafE family protein [Trebonia sp.]|nr:sulfite exporter TauE/SafE family protein [Trebonia sp.]